MLVDFIPYGSTKCISHCFLCLLEILLYCSICFLFLEKSMHDTILLSAYFACFRHDYDSNPELVAKEQKPLNLVNCFFNKTFSTDSVGANQLH